MSNFQLAVSEIFYSIQGEGPNFGKPAVFLRLSGCNLRCTWCDSRFAAISNVQFPIANDEVLKKIRQFNCKHLVITGGEPLLQQDGLLGLLKRLKGYFVEVETNGSIPLKIGKFISQINCSPKLSSSGNKSYALKIKPTDKKVIYKFVIKDIKDLKEVRTFTKKHKIPKNRAWLMPEGINSKKIIERSKWLVEVCKKEGVNFSPRLHVMLWGNKRGV